MSRGYGYTVYVRADDARTDVAKFKQGDDAYQYATMVAGGRFLAEKFTVSVVGWDGRVWWQWKRGELTNLNQSKKVQL